MKRGDKFCAPTMRCALTVIRVAKDKSWADVSVRLLYSDDSWTKRQPLFGGEFAFPVRALLPSEES